MSYPINYPTPQGANVQIFNAQDNQTSNRTQTWVKPQGASFVWFTLIGAGGNGDGTSGGASAAVTNFMCPAFLIPDLLQVRVATGGSGGIDTLVVYQQKNTAGYTLLTAKSAVSTVQGGATAANAFTAMGFYQSTAGDAGTQTVSPSATTFLSQGGNLANPNTTNYGYTVGAAGTTADGFFMMQPIIVGGGGKNTGRGGIGCGGGSAGPSIGGSGLVVIITW